MSETHTSQHRAGKAFDRQLARIAVGAYDDAQDVRKAMLNRIRDLIRKRNEGIPFDQVEDEKEDPSYDEKYADDNLGELITEMHEKGTLTETEFEYLDKMLDAAAAGQNIENIYQDVMSVTAAEPIYTEWLTNVYGVSTTLTARLLHQFGYCEDFDRVSNLWSYCGLAPGQTRTRGEKADYSPQAKTLAWNVADCIIKQGDRSKYREEFYDPYKAKQLRRMKRADDMTEAQLEAQEWTPPESRGHADNRARRYLGKKLLKHYWAITRDLRGLETPDEYILTHGGHEKQTETFENPFWAKRYVNRGQVPQ